MPPLAHFAAIRIAAPADDVFRFLADPLRLGDWSLGCMRTGPSPVPGVYGGVSLFDGGTGYFRVDADAGRLLIDYHVGRAPDALTPRITARVTPGAVLGLGARECLAALTAWRPAAMSDDRWLRLCATHQAEMHLIKAQIETARNPA